MNLINLLDYANIIYNLGDNINKLTRENSKCDTKPSTAIKMTMMAIFSGRGSVNQLQEAIFNDGGNKLKGIFSPKEFIPKTHAYRDCL